MQAGQITHAHDACVLLDRCRNKNNNLRTWAAQARVVCGLEYSSEGDVLFVAARAGLVAAWDLRVAEAPEGRFGLAP